MHVWCKYIVWLTDELFPKLHTSCNMSSVRGCTLPLCTVLYTDRKGTSIATWKVDRKASHNVLCLIRRCFCRITLARS